MILINLAILYLLQKTTAYFCRKIEGILSKTTVFIAQAFVYAILFCYQGLLKNAFALLQCVEIADDRVLFIQGDVVCYTWWQIAIHVFVYLYILPLVLVLSHCPFQLQEKMLTLKEFLLACVFPFPFLFCQFVGSCFRAARKKTATNTHFEDAIVVQSSNPEQPCSFESDLKGTQDLSEESKESISSHPSSEEQDKEQDPQSKSKIRATNEEDREVLDGEAEEDTKPNKMKQTEKNQECEDAVIEIFLKHYNCLSIAGFRFTWFLINKLYRTALIVCNTYITEPVSRLCVMTLVLMAVTLANTFTQPYKDVSANRTATLSYVANLCVAVVNVCKALLVTFDTKRNYAMRVLFLH